MSISTSIPSLTQVDRTYKAILSSPYNGTYTAQIFRERMFFDANNNQVGASQIMPPITVTAAQVGDIIVNGMTGAQVQSALESFFDSLATAANE